MAQPTSPIGAFDAKTHLSALLDRVEAGETITITRHGKPVALLTPAPKAGERVPGRHKGRFPIDDRFFEPLPEEFLAPRPDKP